MLSIQNLNFSIGPSQILKGIDLEIRSGEIACLIGPNGAGKSTLIKCINRILSPSPKSVFIDGRAVEDYRPRELARMVAYVPQQAGPGMAMQVIDVIALGRSPHAGLATRAESRAVVSAVIERLHLTSLAFTPFGQLSGGQRQRVLIARAMAQQGQLLLLDESTSNLDPFYQLEMMTSVQDLAKEHGIAIIAVLHDLSLAARFADRVFMMNKGRIHAQGTWKQVLTPANLETVFGVSAIVGSDCGLPYVIPVSCSSE